MKNKVLCNKKVQLSIMLIVILVILLQTITIYVSNNISREGNDLIPNILSITNIKNTGGAFGIGSNDTLSFTFVSIIVLVIIFRFIILQRERMSKTTVVSLSLMMAGGISNLIDRIVNGAVTDYIDISKMLNFPVFNLADILVFIGWIMLVISIIISWRSDKIKGKQLEEQIKKNREENNE